MFRNYSRKTAAMTPAASRPALWCADSAELFAVVLVAAAAGLAVVGVVVDAAGALELPDSSAGPVVWVGLVVSLSRMPPAEPP
jgi:hypothetical protein